MNDSLSEIIVRIDEILLNEKNDSIDMLGSYIVGATIVREDYEYYKNKYHFLDEIAEYGAELEMLDGIEAETVLCSIKMKLSLLKQQVAEYRA